MKSDKHFLCVFLGIFGLSDRAQTTRKVLNCGGASEK